MKIIDMQGGIKNIIFDLGGVIYAIDYYRTIIAFKNIGINNFDQLFAKAGQQNLFDDLEIGAISPIEFCAEINLLVPYFLTEKQITQAWNAMLLEFMPDALACLDKISSDYRLFLLSNTNIIHINAIKNQIGTVQFNAFCKRFENVYFSHEIGLRKPNTEVFEYILNERGLINHETLFIDDSIQHIQGAKYLGIKVHHLKDNQTISQLFP